MEESHEHDHESDHQPPPSPGVSPVQLKDCIQELLKFTLDGTLVGLDIIGLSKDYCSNLLKDDPVSPNPNNTSHTTGFSEGVPAYPLYKLLASALYHSISFATFHRAYDTMALIHDDISFKQKEDEWIELVVEKGLELLKVLKNVDFELHVQEPFFSQLKDGMKTVEGRCAVGDYNRNPQGRALWTRPYNPTQGRMSRNPPRTPQFQSRAIKRLVEVSNSGPMVMQAVTLPTHPALRDVRRYASFSEMLEAESLTKVLPGVKAIEEGVEIYRKFYSEEKERSNGVLAICVTKPAVQPYISLASILSGLSYGGLQRLLGFVHTVGTTVEALPPPRSTLLSSFLLPHNPNVEGSTLTDGARALAKHVTRSSSKYWGAYGGSDSNKNKFAKDAISHLIAHCCWQNLHIVPPHGVVYEIRIADGYGARWSEDGTKFIGFLEPYMEDGHSKGWKH